MKQENLVGGNYHCVACHYTRFKVFATVRGKKVCSESCKRYLIKFLKETGQWRKK